MCFIVPVPGANISDRRFCRLSVVLSTRLFLFIYLCCMCDAANGTANDSPTPSSQLAPSQFVPQKKQQQEKEIKRFVFVFSSTRRSRGPLNLPHNQSMKLCPAHPYTHAHTQAQWKILRVESKKKRKSSSRSCKSPAAA